MSRPAYERLRRRLLVARLRAAIYAGLVALPLGAVMNVLCAPDRLAERLAGFALLFAAYAAMLGITSWSRLVRYPRALAVGFMATLGAGLLYLLSLSPTDLDVLTAPVSCVMIGTTLFFPWGAAAQLLVSGPLAVGYAAILWPHAAFVGMRGTNVATSLAVSVALSVLGAMVLEHSRRMAFADRQRVRALAVQRRHLIDIGRDLRGTLHAGPVAARVVAHAERLIACDGAVLIVRQERTGSYRVVETAGNPTLRTLIDVEWADDFARALCDRFAPAEVRELPGSPVDELVMPTLRQLDVVRALVATVGPHPAPAGFLVWARRAETAFTRHERLAAQGIADQALTALTAARLYDEAARASRLKSEFVSTMSHELRTPLNVIVGYNQILGETLPPDPETVKALDAVRRASGELLELVEATLDLGRLEAGRDPLHEERVSVRDLFDQLAREFAALPRAPGVALQWDVGEDVSLVVDRQKLARVLKNLTGNALKFTPAGSVRVECRAIGQHCRFRVIDTGVGIRPEDQAAVFEMFRQVDSSDTRRYGGTGLGLYIVRQLVRQLGGEVSLDSALGRGSTFTVTVPLAGVASSRQRSAA